MDHTPTFRTLPRAIGPMFTLTWQAYPFAAACVLASTLAQGILPLASAWITKLLFDLLAVSAGQAQFSLSQDIVLLLAAQATVAIATQLLPSITKLLNAELQRRLTVRIESTIFRKINSFPGIAYFENPDVYDTIRMAGQGAAHSTQQSLASLTSFLQNGLLLVSFMAVLLRFNPMLALLVLLSALPQLIIHLRLGQDRVDMAFSFSPDERRKFYYSYLLGSVEAAKEVRLFGLGEHFLARLLKLHDRVHTAERKLERRELGWELALGIIASVVNAIAFVLVVRGAFLGTLSLGDVALYVNAVIAVQAALLMVVRASVGLFEGGLFYSFYQKLMALRPALQLAEQPQPVPTLDHSIEFRNVWFRYHDDQPWILRDLNLVIPAGSCVALVGLNGAGKTTLVKLLTRLYDPTEGEILWDGIDIRRFDPAELREQIGAIFQDFMRYDLTVGENIGLGDVARVDDEARWQVSAEIANIADDIANLPNGYQTEITRMFAEDGRGTDLSGGQWQRVATARMLMRAANLLILDEPTSALDAKAEFATYSDFTNLVEGRTSLLISHRFSTTRMADQIAILENGTIVELGSHADLLAGNGTYAYLYRLQASSYHDPQPM